MYFLPRILDYPLFSPVLPGHTLTLPVVQGRHWAQSVCLSRTAHSAGISHLCINNSLLDTQVGGQVTAEMLLFTRDSSARAEFISWSLAEMV